MDFVSAMLRCSLGGHKDVVAGQKALERIQSLLTKRIIKSNGVPHALTVDEIAPIQEICDQLFPANFQLKVPSPKEIKSRQCVHYQHVYEDEIFSIGIFILPPGVSIPLHDHPSMSVISRLLYGTLSIKSYDLVKNSSSKTCMARLYKDVVVTAPETIELLPDRGNLHELVGGGDIGCAFLDIITPPYDVDAGRDCTYYREVSKDDKNGETFVQLEIFTPENFHVITETYLGPQLRHQ